MDDRICFKHSTTGHVACIASGFNWAACLLGFIWAFSEKLWTLALSMLAVNVTISLIGMTCWRGFAASAVLSVAFAIFCG